MRNSLLQKQIGIGIDGRYLCCIVMIGNPEMNHAPDLARCVKHFYAACGQPISDCASDKLARETITSQRFRPSIP